MKSGGGEHSDARTTVCSPQPILREFLNSFFFLLCICPHPLSYTAADDFLVSGWPYPIKRGLPIVLIPCHFSVLETWVRRGQVATPHCSGRQQHTEEQKEPLIFTLVPCVPAGTELAIGRDRLAVPSLMQMLCVHFGVIGKILSRSRLLPFLLPCTSPPCLLAFGVLFGSLASPLGGVLIQKFWLWGLETGLCST